MLLIIIPKTEKSIIGVLITCLLFIGCSSHLKNNKLEVSFHLNEVKGFVPSYQMAIWLEKPDGKLVKTFFVCNYLSYGGFTIHGICPDWTGKADWGNANKEIVDAVSQATPKIGDILYKFDCPKDEVPNGKYKYFIEIHISEDFNELYSGDIETKDDGNKSASEAVVAYLPKKHPKVNNLLSKVRVRYK